MSRVVQTSLSGFDVIAVAVVGCEYDQQVLKLQYYSHKAMYTICQWCTCSVASWLITIQLWY